MILEDVGYEFGRRGQQLSISARAAALVPLSRDLVAVLSIDLVSHERHEFFESHPADYVQELHPAERLPGHPGCCGLPLHIGYVLLILDVHGCHVLGARACDDPGEKISDGIFLVENLTLLHPQYVQGPQVNYRVSHRILTVI